MHLFLTGEKRVGKTTIIRSFLSQTGITADGFMTYWELDGDGMSLYLSPYGAAERSGKRHFVTRFSAGKSVRSEETPIVFDVHGSEILRSSGNCGVIVMDELGFLESKAHTFQKAVAARISGDVPVLGVIKPMRTEFLDSIRGDPRVEIREVTEENRAAVLEWLLERNWR